jgi:UPF0755 protein
MRSPALRQFAIGVTCVLALAVAACRDTNTTEVRVVIPRGATLRSAADSLARARVIGSAFFFRVYTAFTKHDRSLRAGTYLLKPSMTWSELFAVLHGGKSVEPMITIPEGWSLNQIVPQLARVIHASPESIEVVVRDTALRHELDVPTETIEGYLFPDTYVIPEGTSPRQAIRLMVSKFEQTWQPAWDSVLQKRAMSRNDVMALASIVEKEARRPEERPVIAAVYMNRLKAGMLLQADPTVQYAIGHHVTRVLYRDLEINSPYNTYRNKGLPPGPIASPGKPSIVAALNPANVPYLYFVAHPDGHHEFTTTLAQHAQAVKRARREWDSVATMAKKDTVQPPANLMPAR